MNEDQWTTIVFALERYIEELQAEGTVVSEHVWKTLELAVRQLNA